MKQISLFDFDEPVKQPVDSKETAEQALSIEVPGPIISEQKSGIDLMEEAVEAFFTKVDDVTPPVIIDLPIELNAATKHLLQQKKKGRGRKSQKEMAASVHYVNVPEDEELFSKQYYSIGTVAEMFSENISLIRFWENEFDILKPKKNGKGNRLFRPEDIKNLKVIHHLLREQKYTLEGAKDFMKRNKKQDETFKVIEELKNVKALLGELKASL